MGNQCCGNQPINRDANEQAFAQAIPVRLQQKLKPESQRFHQVLISSGENDKKDIFSNERQQDFILNLKPYSHLATNDSVVVSIRVVCHDYSYKDELDWYIDESVIIDPNCFETSLLRVIDKKTGNKYTLRVINFNDYEDYEFKQALYQIYIMQLIGNKCKNLISLHDCYILENEDKESSKGSIILLMEYCDSTLHEIISFRKFHNWQWTSDEIRHVFGELAQALGQLEQLNITHRDLRPHNIWYCSLSKTYKIGGYEEAKFVKKAQTLHNQLSLNNLGINIQQENEELLNTIRGVPDYLPPEVQKYVDASGAQTVGRYNPFLADVYQLGLNILMMDQLEVNFESTELRNVVKKLNNQRAGSRGSSNDYHDVLKLMLVGDESSRLTPAELSLFTKSYLSEIPINEDNLVESMKYKKKYAGIESTKVYQLIAVAYYDLFEWEKWLEKMEEILVTYENAKDDFHAAEVLFDIANGFIDINNLSSAQDYFMKASILYNEIGHQLREQGKLNEALDNYERALDCVRKAHNGDDSYEGALLLENLANGYRLQGNLVRARSFLEEACRITEQEKGADSLEFAKMSINLGKVHSLLGDYKHALKRVKKGLRVTEGHASGNQNLQQSMLSYNNQNQQQQNQALLMKAQGLTMLGEIQRLKGTLGKAKKNIEEALAIREKLQGSGNLEVASTIEVLGNVFFEMEDYHQAKSQYEKALVIKKSKLGENHVEVALTLNNIGNSCKHLEEYDKSQKFFADALVILKQSQSGDDHPLVATTYGNLGILLKQIGNIQSAQQCLTKCIQILDKTLPKNHPDSLFYREQLQEIQQ
ncbi:unnamed protein product (macronuclear) [Paramecium tetraurelia]|uniref:Protein kinase domain-containing protein n=1 Tax=Paramecium tetraurelia TaxID=5888 RepID=A0CB20_PARTE|nr:uncharacterized protein GSPATT00036770001 [Paramecium tetraurelia]CAK67987.1 unnamed protein product [Paramecium tetraurelia]|eukprot:XP_001435384.1 hypothetical protein (macronuclear) [Paramecium tetraurelia strain d4-2]